MEGPSASHPPASEALPLVVEETAVTSQEIKDLLEAAKQTLPVAFREDGPPLGFEFDPVPFGRKLMAEGHGKSKMMVIGEYNAEAAEDGSIQEIRKRQQWASGQKRKAFVVKPFEGNFNETDQHQQTMLHMERHPRLDKEMEKEMKKKEKKLHKEQERRQREQQKEMERQQREREKKLKAQLKEEEKQKLQLERDMKKLERDLERERKSEERKKLQEVKRREKDLQKAFAAQVKVAQKELQKELAQGPPEDLDLEMEKLMKDVPADDDPPERPLFPSMSSELDSAFPQLGNTIGGDIVMIWGFVQSFADIMALPPFSLNEFIAALHIGQKSALLSSIHIVLLRLIQADMEESHHLVLTQGSGGTSNFMDRAVVGIAGTLDEAISWGFDVDAWRAHLNSFTWPEILRQIAIAAGYGAKRSRGLRDKYQKSTDETEDAIAEESRAGYGLKMPSRLTQGTVKAAAWQVLSEVGPEGLTISEIATRIQKQGLRDLRTSKTPEATVAGALSRDAVFCRVAPATYALHAVLPTAENQSQPSSSCMEGMEPSSFGGDEIQGEAPMRETETTHRFIQGEPWIPLLSNSDYDMLTLEEKLEVLKTLCNMALECPTIRACLDGRLEREIAEQKRMEIEAKAEKRARREQAAEEAQRRLMELENVGGMETHENLDAKVKDLMTESLQTVIPDPLSTKLPLPSAQDHVRFEPLGKDRRHNRYWSFSFKKDTERPNAERPDHLFLELNGQFKILKSRQQLQSLIRSLEPRGAREGPLHAALCQYEQNLHDDLPVWKEGEDDANQMDIVVSAPTECCSTLFARKWARIASLDRQLRHHDESDWLFQIKTHLFHIHQALSKDSKPDLDEARWNADLDAAESIDDVLVCMGQLEHALVAHILHSNYNRAPQILYGAWSDTYDPEIVTTAEGFLCWVPRSFAAAFLHIFRLDAALCYHSGSPTGRDALLSYKYVQKPFVRELNAHLDVTSVTHTLQNASQIVSVEPIRPGGKLAGSVFPVLQKGQPVQKQPIPFSFQVDKIREAVDAAERHGTLYANIHMTKGRGKSTRKKNGIKTIHCLTGKRPKLELEDEVSNSGVVASSDDVEALNDDDDVDDDDDDDVEDDDDEDENETNDRSEMSRDEADDDDVDDDDAEDEDDDEYGL